MGDKSEVTYKGSPLQNQMAGMVMPPLEKAFGGAMQGNVNQNLWKIPSYSVPNAPHTSGYAIEGWKPGDSNFMQMNPTASWNTQGVIGQPAFAQVPTGVGNISGSNAPLGYNVPGISGLMPNKGWYENLDPSIQQGMMEPTNVAAREMLNVMGGQGQMSARGGYSGEAQTALADLYSKGAQQAGMNAWNMISPIQQGQWGAQLGANQYGADIQNQFLQNTINAQNQAIRDAWGYNTTADMAKWQSNLGLNQWWAQNQLNQNAYPYQMAPSLWGGSVPNPVVSPTTAGNVGGSILPMLAYGFGRALK